MKIPLSDVVYRDDLYPRIQIHQERIRQYAESIEFLPPIEVNQDRILIDGFHRWKAHQMAGAVEIEVTETNTSSDRELRKKAFIQNSTHGIQLTPKEKRTFAIEYIGELSVDEICKLISVSKSSVTAWTAGKRRAMKEERNRKMWEMWLRARNTLDVIGKAIGIDKATVSRDLKKIKGLQNAKIVKMQQGFDPLAYNIWYPQENTQNQTYPGFFPYKFMENVIYYYTDAFDVIYDPFAGGGTTVDVCKEWGRRYYCSDVHIEPGREKDVVEWDVTKGVPKDLPKVNLIFLDPPYWIQGKGKYEDHENNLANMSLERFYETLGNLFEVLYSQLSEGGLVAFVISGTREFKTGKYYDHVLDVVRLLEKRYEYVNRIWLPYPTCVHSGNEDKDAKKKKHMLPLQRELLIYQKGGAGE